MKEFAVILAFIILLTGVVHTFRFSNALRNLAISTLYSLGFLGLLFVFRSSHQKSIQKQYIIFTIGFSLFLGAFAIIEVLLKLGF